MSRTEATRGVTETRALESKKSAEVKTEHSATTRPETIEAVEEKVLDYIKRRGGSVTKDELLSWAKLRGIRTALLLKVIDSLSQRKLIVRRLCDDKLCYEIRSP